MKKYILAVAIVMLIVGMAGSTWAATTSQTVNTTATVQTMCNNGTNGTLGFGSIDPSGGSNVNAVSTGLTYKCSTGTSFSVTAITGGNGASPGTCAGFNGIMKDAGTDLLNYSITCSAGPYSGLGFSPASAVGINLNGQVTPAQFQNAVPGVYTDLVTVTITY